MRWPFSNHRVSTGLAGGDEWGRFSADNAFFGDPGLFEERLGLFVGIVCRSVLELALGFVPELFLTPVRSPGDFPQFVRADADLFFGRVRYGSTR